jgi:hypothetical protein
MTMLQWGRGLTYWGLVGGGVALLPAILMWILPPQAIPDFFALIAIMLALSVAPLGVAVASVGVILLLVAVVRRGRG